MRAALVGILDETRHSSCIGTEQLTFSRSVLTASHTELARCECPACSGCWLSRA